jgi:predicted metal-binding protein
VLHTVCSRHHVACTAAPLVGLFELLLAAVQSVDQNSGIKKQWSLDHISCVTMRANALLLLVVAAVSVDVPAFVWGELKSEQVFHRHAPF